MMRLQLRSPSVESALPDGMLADLIGAVAYAGSPAAHDGLGGGEQRDSMIKVWERRDALRLFCELRAELEERFGCQYIDRLAARFTERAAVTQAETEAP